MILKFHGFGNINPFIFKVYSYEAAEKFICSLCDHFCPRPNGADNYVGLYLTLLTIYNEGAYKPQFVIEEVKQ